MTTTNPSTEAAGAIAPAFDSAVVAGPAAGGAPFVPASSPLTRLNYYDGRFLRADDLQIEQRAQRALVELSNRAGGAGLVHGFDVSLAGGVLELSGGLAVDPHGRVLYLPDAVGAAVDKLVEASHQVLATPDAAATGGSAGPSFADCEVATAAAPTVPTAPGTQLFVVAIAHAEGLCGNAEVFGRLCDDACITATDRPYRRDGVVLLLVPLTLALPTSTAVALTSVHLRSRIASAYFAREWAAGDRLLSAAGLRSQAWCAGASALAGDLVPVAVLSWTGTGGFVDEWTARRERMDAPPRSYWAGRLEQRPWPAFLAQLMQFQCQLAHLLVSPPAGGVDDPVCEDARRLLAESTRRLEELATEAASVDDILAFTQQAKAVLDAAGAATPSTRRLIAGGLIELPPAGFLPIDLASARTVREQAQEWMGAGVDLRVCAVRRDQIAHELERAQHMDRISLVAGLDDPAAVQDVDILVPDGSVENRPASASGITYQVGLALGPSKKRTADEVAAPGPWSGSMPPPMSSRAAPPWFRDGGTIGGEISSGGGIPPEPASPRQAEEALRDFLAEADADRKVLPIEGVARLSVDAGVELHLAALGSGDDSQLRRLLGALGHLTQGLKGYESRANRLSFDEMGDTSGSTMTAVELIGTGVAKFLLNRSNRIVISLDDALETPPLAVWLTLRLDREPWAMAVGESSTLTGRVTLFLPSTPSRLVDVHVSATFEVLAHGLSERGPRVSIRLTARTFGEFVNLADLPDPVAGGSFDVDLDRESAGSGLLVTVRSDPEWRFLLGWKGEPTRALGSVSYGTASGTKTTTRKVTPLVTGMAVENPAAAVPGSEHQQAALAALNLLHGFRPDDRTFPAIAAAQLFPDGAASLGGTVVRPRHDWVLFRRRRRESCEGPAPAAPPARTIQVATWLAHAKYGEQAAEMQRRLQAGDESGSWKRIGSVEFEPGSAALVTSPAQWRSDWAAAGGRSVVTFVGYAPNGASLDPFLQPRAEALVAALAPAAALTAGGEVALIGAPPATQMVAGTDASMFLVTVDAPDEPPETARGCVEVFCVEEKLAGFVDDGTARDLNAIELNLGDGIEQVGHVLISSDGVDEASAHHALAGLEECWKRVSADTGRGVQPRGAAFIAVDAPVPPNAESTLEILATEWGISPLDIRHVAFDPNDRCPIRIHVIAATVEIIG